LEKTDNYCVEWRKAVEKREGLLANVRYFARNRLLDVLSVLPGDSPNEFLRCLYCHFVFDDQVNDFRNLIEALSESGRFVDTETVLAMQRGERQIDGRYFHLSFDDGLKNNIINAAPVLSELNIPALFFVPSGFIGADFENTSLYCLDKTKYRDVIEMMSWDDCRKLVKSGFEIGCHSHSHAHLSEISIDPYQVNREVVDAKLMIEDAIGLPCDYFSWPYGSKSEVNKVILESVRQAGYKACFGGFRGAVVPGVTDRFMIPRHHFEAHWPLRHLKMFANGFLEEK